MKKLIFTLLCCLCTVVANAEEYTDENGVTWTYSCNYYDYSISITAATGFGENVICPDVIIHDEVECPVKRMSSDIFNGSRITSIQLPNGLESITSGMFQECKQLRSVTLPQNLKGIEYHAFHDCSALNEITIPESVESIWGYAFMNCSSLTSINIPDGVTSIGDHAFEGCSSLTSISIPKGVSRIEESTFQYCSDLTSITIPESVTYIGNWAFAECSSLTSITLPEKLTSIRESVFFNCSNMISITIPKSVTSIGDHAFCGCSSLTSITLPAGVESIGNQAFYICSSLSLVKMEGTTPPSLSSFPFEGVPAIFVPDQAAYENYCAHADWKGLVPQLTYEAVATQAVTLEADNEVSALYTAIGEENLKFVYDLTIEGTINGADIYIMRNKMPVLCKLDLSQARIVSGGGAYYQGYTTQDDIVGQWTFQGLNLYEVKLPTSLTGIDNWAFAYCTHLQRIDIPEGVKFIGSDAFYCTNLKEVTFPKTLKKIGSSAFGSCPITKIILPIGLENIGSGAFAQCVSLKEVRFPSGLKDLGAEAFAGCIAITDVYAYTVEPVDMTEGTFSTNIAQTATLHYPLTSKYNYYTNGGWGQFLNMEEFDEPYEYFYLNNDYTLNQDNGGVIDGTPDVDINEGGGLIVEDDLNGSTDEETQHTDDMNIHHNGGHGGDGVGGSIIAGDNLHANKVHFRINVRGGQWHFFAFPFNIKKENIQCEGGADWVFHYYDGQERANNGKGGWKKVTSEEGQGNFLKAGMGYIFQSSKDDVLVITVDEDNDPDEEGIRFDKENKSNAMEAHASQNEQDASWNFMGNPHLSYYDLDAETYDAPITVWDGEKYVAVRPGDDEYQLAPFQAFFVQKPNDVDEIEFKRDNQMTHQQKENKAATVSAYARTRSFDGRLIVNITLSDNNHSDNTRVVFNDARKMDYERACDAAKFASAGVPQLYTLDSRKVKYAINERPQEEGSVAMGYSVPAYGSYTIDAPRMDTPMVLKDLLTGIIHDFDEGSYSFASEAGTFDNRFVLMTRAAATGMDVATLGHIQVSATEGGIGVSQLGGATLNVFTTAGEKVASTRTDGVIAVTAGIYMVEADGKSVKVVVK